MADVLTSIGAVQARIDAINARARSVQSRSRNDSVSFDSVSFDATFARSLSSSRLGVAANSRPTDSSTPPADALARWQPMIDQAATDAGVPPELLTALVWTESGFRSDAVSSAGAIGLTQLMPGTAAGLGVDPTDPMENLRGGARYLRAQLDRFGSLELALAAYNAGPARVEQSGGIPNIPETQHYVAKVTGRYQQLSEGTP